MIWQVVGIERGKNWNPLGIRWEKMDNEKEYEERIEEVADKFEPRIKDKLERLAKDFEKAANFSFDKIVNTTDEEYSWSAFMDVDDVDEGIAQAFEIRFELNEERVREGGYGKGVAFSLDITYCGRPVSRFTPGNFSDDLWINMYNDEEVEHRFEQVEGISSRRIVNDACSRIMEIKEKEQSESES